MTNVPHIIETALLLLVAYLIGCIIGYALRRLAARPIPLQGEAAKPVAAPIVVAPPPAPTSVQPARELSAAARLAMASPPEPITPSLPKPVPQPPLTPALPPVLEVSANKVEQPKPAPPMIEPVPSETTIPIAAPVKAVRKVVKVGDEPVQPIAPAAKPSPKTQKAVKPVVTESVGQAVEASAKLKLPAFKTPKPASKPAAKSAPKKPADPKPAALAAPRAGGADDLKLIKGIGPKIEQTLNDLGIFHFDQLAKLTKANVGWLDDHLGFKGRVTREAWLDQAKALSKPKR